MTVPVETLPDEAPPHHGLAETFDTAASLIEDCTLHRGDYWPEALALPYRPGLPLDLVGAVAVAMGVYDAHDIDRSVIGTAQYNPVRHAHEDNPTHPAITTLLTHLRLADVESLFIWSDIRRGPEVAAELRTLAAKLRIEAAA